MILKDLIDTLSKEDFLRIGELQEDELTRMEGLTANDLAKIFEKFCNKLSSLTVEPSDSVLLALPSISENGEVTIGAEYFKKDDLEEKLRKISEMPDLSYSDADSTDQYTDLLEEVDENIIPTAYGYEFTAWEQVLGSAVFPENYELMGRVEFVSAALGEMSFNGMTRDHQEERREELVEATKEAEELSKLPEEERKDRFFSTEEVFAELGVERESKEDWDEELRKMMLGCVRTRDAWIKELKRISGIVLGEGK